MKTKLIFSASIAAIFIAAMLIFNKTMTLGEIILAFTGAGGTIGWVWNWLSKEEKKQEIQSLRTDFKDAVGTDVETFKREYR